MLVGPRVTLRPIEETDLLAVAQILAKPGVAEWWPVHSEAALRSDILEDEESVSLAIEYDGRLIGLVMYSEDLWRDYFAVGIDIALDVDFRGQGLGPEVLKTLIAWLIDVGGHHRIYIDPAAANTPAIKAYEKAGFKRSGIMREYELGPDGKWRDGLLMDLLAREFERLA
ncbi:MAG: GNAT family N-acetyltransferase [Coriobacteriales bacterium]|nr:GNAT family N-acetyltransferase [Coriobacteriales bacterium]